MRDKLSANYFNLSNAVLATYAQRKTSLYYFGVRVTAAIAYQLPRGVSTMEGTLQAAIASAGLTDERATAIAREDTTGDRLLPDEDGVPA